MAAAAKKKLTRISHPVGDNKGKTQRRCKKLPPSHDSSLCRSICKGGELAVAAVAFLGGLLTPPLLHTFPGGTRDHLAVVSHHRNNSSDVSLPFPPLPLPDHVPCTSSNLEDYLHASPFPGLHVVCVEQLFLDGDGREISLETPAMRHRLAQSNSISLTFYRDSHAGSIRRRATVSGSDKNDSVGVYSVAWSDVKKELVEGLGLAPEGPNQQPWAVFTSRGERIVGENDDVDDSGSNRHILHSIAASGMLVISQGGMWVWPPVREGFKRIVDISSGTQPQSVSIETLSLKPLVVSIEGFLTDDECDYIAEKARPSMKYSGVSLKDADRGRAASDWRTSQSTFLNAGNDAILKDIENRTASLARVPRTHQEYVQVLRYGTNEKYDAHHDFFDPRSYRSDPNTLNLIQHGKRNRFATVFWYLTTVDEGGHTIFPRAGGLPPVRSHSDCSKGLKVQPQKGKVIIFYSLDATGAMDELSLHGACPVGENNVKWAANKWIWNAPMSFVN